MATSNKRKSRKRQSNTDTDDREGDRENKQPNRFSLRTERSPYTEKADYLRAMSELLTPDLWDAIVTRAIHDATLGTMRERTKAREWVAKYVLPINTEIELPRELRTDHDLLLRVYRMLEADAVSDENMKSALAITLGVLSPEERATLQEALTHAGSDEIRELWERLKSVDIED